MKKFFTITYAALVSAALLCATSACKDDEPAVPKPEKLLIEVSQIEMDDATVTVTPGNAATRYIAAVDFAADFDALKTIATNKAAFAANAEAAGKTLADFIEGYAFKGIQSFHPSTLSPKTEYIVYAYGIDDKGDATTEITTTDFTTLAVTPGEKVDCTINILVKNLTDVSAEVTYSPTSDEVFYYYTFTDQAGYDALSQDWAGFIYTYMTSHITENLTLEDVVKVLCSRGEVSSRAKNLTPATSYYACAVGVSMEALLITDVAVEKVTTPAEHTIDYSFDSTVDQITWNGAKVTITPRDATALYYWNVMTEAEYTTLGGDETKIAAYFEEAMIAKRAAELGAYADYYPLADYILNQCSDKADEYEFTSLSSSTKYYVYAFWVDDGSAEKISATYFSKPFATLERIVSSATVTAALWLTDGDDWAALNPTGFGHFAGKAILGARLTPGSGAVHWYSNIFAAADLDSFSDEAFIAALKKNGNKDKTSYYRSYGVDWGGDYAIVSIAEDADGNTGNPVKLHFKADKSVAEKLTEIPEE